MTPPPAVSVILTCYNLGEYLPDAVKSVEACRPSSYELIIVDDGSTDEKTISVLARIGQEGRHQIIYQTNQGVAAARNAGIRAAKGRYILPVDADNMIRPDYVYLGTKILDENPSVGVVYGNSLWFGEESRLYITGPFSPAMIIGQNKIDTCAVFRKSIWEECGGYDSQMPVQGAEDWDFWLTVAEKNWKFHYIDKILFDYRVRAGSMVRYLNQPENWKRVVDYVEHKHLGLLRTELRRLQGVESKLHHHPVYRLYKVLKGLLRSK